MLRGVRMGSPSSQRFKVLADEEQGPGERSEAGLWPHGQEIKNNHQQPRASPCMCPLQPLCFQTKPLSSGISFNEHPAIVFEGGFCKLDTVGKAFGGCCPRMGCGGGLPPLEIFLHGLSFPSWSLWLAGRAGKLGWVEVEAPAQQISKSVKGG